MELRKKIRAKDFAMTHCTPSALMISGACSGGSASEVLSCYNNVALLDLSGQLRTKGAESVLFHIVNGFQCKVLRRDNDIRINIITKYPHFSCKCFHMYISCLFRSVSSGKCFLSALL